MSIPRFQASLNPCLNSSSSLCKSVAVIVVCRMHLTAPSCFPRKLSTRRKMKMRRVGRDGVARPSIWAPGCRMACRVLPLVSAVGARRAETAWHSRRVGRRNLSVYSVVRLVRGLRDSLNGRRLGLLRVFWDLKGVFFLPRKWQRCWHNTVALFFPNHTRIAVVMWACMCFACFSSLHI